ncbi:MAG: hypothetical protein PHD32_09820 [Eubacteriales bacterium]|nr:hypothetical protein [Eubacteriales bacterium]
MKKLALWQRTLSLLLILTLAFSLAACGSAEPDPQDPEVSPDTSSAPAVSTDGIQVIQVMAKGLDSTSGELFDMTQFVAGKDTLLAAPLPEGSEVTSDGSMSLSVAKDGQELIQLLPVNAGATGGLAMFTPKAMGDVGNWSAGEYTFTFVNGEETMERKATFQESKKIKVLAIPVIANYAGRVVSCEGEWKTAIQFTQDCYPISKDGIEYVLGSELDLSDASYDLTTDEGQYNVWAALAALQTPSNDYELILGFVRERQGADGTTQGYTYGLPANIITESDGDMQPTVAHEIAHCYNVGDEYPGGAINNAVNPAPYGMEGSDWSNRDATISGNKEAVVSATQFGNENTGSVVKPEQIPVDVAQMKTLATVGSFMGSGSSNMDDYWITSDIWNQLYKAFVTGEATSQANAGTSQAGGLTCPGCYNSADASGYEWYGCCETCGEYTAVDMNTLSDTFTCGSCGAATAATTQSICGFCAQCQTGATLETLQSSASQKSSKTVTSAEATEIRAIDITGTLYADGKFTATPWFAYTASSADVKPQRSGAYSVVMENAAGETLSRQYFDVSFYTQSNPPVKKDFTPVNVTVRYPEGAAKIRVMQGDKELFTQSVSANAPEVAFTGITENQEYAGKATISWTGSDADGDALSYELWYCTSEGEYTNVASNLTATSYEVNFDNLPGAQNAYFYLYATDGANTAEMDSPYINVAFKAPEIISKQTAVPEYKITDEILFDADVYDMQDGWLYEDSEVKWMLDGREYMTGSLLWIYPYELTPGDHVFTLNAVNSQGVSSTAEFTFRVENDESALPNDWSRQDIKSALSNGFIAPLQNVNSAMTRGQFARLAANLYWNVWEDGSPNPDYEEGVVTDCGQDDYNPFLMVKLGVMEAPNGKFNPNGQLTEEEAAVILYQVCSLADPAVAAPITDKAEMVETCKGAGMMDESGDNAYTAEKSITGRLALVRCNRLFDAIFGE